MGGKWLIESDVCDAVGGKEGVQRLSIKVGDYEGVKVDEEETAWMILRAAAEYKLFVEFAVRNDP